MNCGCQATSPWRLTTTRRSRTPCGPPGAVDQATSVLASRSICHGRFRRLGRIRRCGASLRPAAARWRSTPGGACRSCRISCRARRSRACGRSRRRARGRRSNCAPAPDGKQGVLVVDLDERHGRLVGVRGLRVGVDVGQQVAGVLLLQLDHPRLEVVQALVVVGPLLAGGEAFRVAEPPRDVEVQVRRRRRAA